jgi:hypothetical protein
MKQYILTLLNEVRWAMNSVELSKMTLKSRLAHEKALIKLEVLRNLIEKFT